MRYFPTSGTVIFLFFFKISSFIILCIWDGNLPIELYSKKIDLCLYDSMDIFQCVMLIKGNLLINLEHIG